MPSPVAFAGQVPAHYDKYLGPVLFEPYARDLAARLKNDHVLRMLEIACGTGRVTRHLEKLVPDNGELVATDLNADMIRMAASQLPSGKITWKVADAQKIPFKDNTFDHVVCQFGVMFFPDKPAAFAEALRVLQKGGKYIFNTWGSLENNPRIIIMSRVLDEILGQNAPDFLQKGPHSFYDEHMIRNMLLDAGFVNVKIESVEIVSEYSSPSDFMKGFIEGSPLSSWLSHLDRELQEKIRACLIAESLKQESEYGNKVPCQAFVVEAIKA